MKAQTMAKVLSAVVLVVLVGHVAGNTAISCHTCEGANCQRVQLNKTQTCVDSLDYCVTIYDEAKVLFKGCSLEIPKDLRSKCDDNGSCHKCNTKQCNNVGSAKYACIQCDSSKDSNCASNAAALAAARCSAPTAPNSYCYVKSSGGSIVRGCSTTETDQLSCLNDANCLLCSPGDIRNCNAANIAESSSAGNRFIRFLR
ncbi:uncharacterized protein LOC6530557 [Drosophila yakuba]|uniref:DUF753 domain-containing protein n=1 Tax=Drosophila yakuba TaxID=7245 RepID=B4P8E2_DROYA|nr:uncharacterized protein LOC6530557 [Drosophila yakuba]EDW91182.1 uncharacterized protein Dyak_GE13672 [Drosophila yakuba]